MKIYSTRRCLDMFIKFHHKLWVFSRKVVQERGQSWSMFSSQWASFPVCAVLLCWTFQDSQAQGLLHIISVSAHTACNRCRNVPCYELCNDFTLKKYERTCWRWNVGPTSANTDSCRPVPSASNLQGHSGTHRHSSWALCHFRGEALGFMSLRQSLQERGRLAPRINSVSKFPFSPPQAQLSTGHWQGVYAFLLLNS